MFVHLITSSKSDHHFDFFISQLIKVQLYQTYSLYHQDLYI